MDDASLGYVYVPKDAKTHSKSRKTSKTPPKTKKEHAQFGIASFYGRKASKALYAAHRTLPFGTRVRVQNLTNGKSVVVTINDRGPFRRGRIVDVSYAAARVLGMISSGLARVKLVVLARGT